MMTQDHKVYPVRTAAILTNAYVAGTTITGVGGNGVHLTNQLELYVDFTIGSLTDAQIKIEFSNDNSAYFQESASSISGGTDTISLLVHKLTATGKYRIAIPIKDRFVKVSVIGTGTVTSSSLAIDAIIGIA